MERSLNEILAYPFDSEMLLRKQRSIKRGLLKSNVNYIKKRIALLGGSTMADVKNLLEIFLLHAGIQPEFYVSEYNKYYEDSVFTNNALDAFQPEFVFVFTSMVNLLYKPELEDDSMVVQQKLQTEYERYEMIWTNLSEKYHAIVIQNNMELPYCLPLGNLDNILLQGIQRFIEALNEKFATYAREHQNFYVHDIHYLAAQIGLEKWHNRFQYHAYKFAVNYDVVPVVAKNMAKIIKSVLGKSKKCLVLDLDNTLWGGVIGDDGVENLQLGYETPQAEAYTEFQLYVLNLKKRGVLLAVCSKNEIDIAKSGFKHPDSVLKLDDFVCFKANWQPKNLNIQEIAKEINIGLDSLVFIDDNPAERQLIRDILPEVAVPEVDVTDVFSYIRAIEGNGYFEAVTISKDDLKRNEAYMENKKRVELQQNVASYDDFLQSLNMEAEIEEFKDVYFDRIAQLTNKSNQFNLTTRRYTLADIERMTMDDRYITLYGRLKDKFGDNGLVSVVIGEIKGKALHINLWLMSCRVLKRGMEQAMLNVLIEKAFSLGITKLVGYYYKTEKNKMVRELYNEFCFVLAEQNEENTIWTLDLDKDYQKQNHFIRVKEI